MENLAGYTSLFVSCKQAVDAFKWCRIFSDRGSAESKPTVPDNAQCYPEYDIDVFADGLLGSAAIHAVLR